MNDKLEAIKDKLEHAGILGMHWGVRRQVGSDGRIIEGTRESADSLHAKELKRKGAKHLSNAELKSYVDRVNLETQYKKLNEKKVSAGRKFAQDILVGSGKAALTTFVSKQMTTQLDRLATK